VGPVDKDGCMVLVGPSDGPSDKDGFMVLVGPSDWPGDKDGCMVLVGPSDGGSAACWRRERIEDGNDNEDEGRGRQSSVIKRPQEVIIVLPVGIFGKIEFF
jgi:hypothetical protein